MSRYAIELIEERYFVVDSHCEGDDAYIGPYKWKVDATLAIETFEAEDEEDGAPYCSYGHRTKAQCDCGPIASNE